MSKVLPHPPRSMRFQDQLGPAALLFVSANIANVANLVFNMIFARLLGPEAFADLTFLLTLKLGVLCILSAFQLAFAQYAAKAWFGKNRKVRRGQTEIYAARLVAKSLFVSVPLMLFALVMAESFAHAFRFADLKALFILITIIPVLFPMIVYRGLSQGRIDLPRIIGSIQGEWMIRLFGGIMLWQLGLGLTGIAFAVILSIFAAFALSMTRSDLSRFRFSTKGTLPQTAQARPKLLLATAPFLALQFAQVLILDGDILLAKASMSAEFAGFTAGLMLIQRIFFFAFLSFSSLLLPVISAKVEKMSHAPKAVDTVKYDTRGRSELMMMIAGVIGLSFPALFILALIPSLGVTLILGAEFSSVSHLAVIAGATGAVFTVTHLCAVYWLANGKTKIAWSVLALAILQITVLGLITSQRPDLDISVFFTIKFGLQAVICAVLLLFTLRAATDTSRPTKRAR